MNIRILKILFALLLSATASVVVAQDTPSDDDIIVIQDADGPIAVYYQGELRERLEALDWAKIRKDLYGTTARSGTVLCGDLDCPPPPPPNSLVGNFHEIDKWLYQRDIEEFPEALSHRDYREMVTGQF
jgi:hypothetical protein